VPMHIITYDARQETARETWKDAHPSKGGAHTQREDLQT
jgi:hypothetical protein